MNSNPKNMFALKAKVFYALSDPARVQILEFLRDGEKCVCEIVPHLNLVQPLVSRHLRILKEVGIVRCRKDGTKRMYSIVDPRIHDVTDSLTSVLVNNLTKEVTNQIMCYRED